MHTHVLTSCISHTHVHSVSFQLVVPFCLLFYYCNFHYLAQRRCSTTIKNCWISEQVSCDLFFRKITLGKKFQCGPPKGIAGRWLCCCHNPAKVDGGGVNTNITGCRAWEGGITPKFLTLEERESFPEVNNTCRGVGLGMGWRYWVLPEVMFTFRYRMISNSWCIHNSDVEE